MSRYMSKHTGNKIDDTIDNVVNPNLLDNWYFGNPVDQRGGLVVPPGISYYGADLTTVAGTSNAYYTARVYATYPDWCFFYIGSDLWYAKRSDCVRGYTGLGYGFDRWQFSGTVLVSASGIQFLATGDFALQPIEASKVAGLHGKMLTLSILTSDNQLITGTLEFNAYSETQEYFAVSEALHLVLTVDHRIMLWCATPCTLVAAKLELGSQQTLAHQDENCNWVLNEIPDFGEQLRRCQHYFRRVRRNYLPIAHVVSGVARASIALDGMRAGGVPSVKLVETPSLYTSTTWGAPASDAVVSVTGSAGSDCNTSIVVFEVGRTGETALTTKDFVISNILVDVSQDL